MGVSVCVCGCVCVCVCQCVCVCVCVQHSDNQSIKKHSYIYKEDKICISQEPVIQCSQDSYPQEMRKKTVNFVCLPEGRTAKLYIERIERGEYPQELKQQPVAFRTEMDQPVSCRPRQI